MQSCEVVFKPTAYVNREDKNYKKKVPSQALYRSNIIDAVM
jgi:hypothetical protein